MATCDEIVAGLVDPQIVSCERAGKKLVVAIEEPYVRGAWQAKLLAAIAADTERGLEEYAVLFDGRLDNAGRINLHTHGPFATATDEEIVDAFGEVTFHRPLGRLAVERRLVVDDAREALQHPDDPFLVGEGFYTEWHDPGGELVRAWGYWTRLRGGIGMWGERYAEYGRRGILG